MVSEGETPTPVSLGPEEAVADRPFTSVDLIERDISVLTQMREDLEAVLAESEAGTRELVPYQRLAWRVDGKSHRLLVCSEPRLREHPQLCVVGFFADRRTDLDMKPLDEANMAMVSEFAQYPGILSYSSIELPGGHWGNLVLHDDPVDKEYWRKSKLHAKAVELLSPVHYRNVRIHNGRLGGPLFSSPRFVIERTKYFDFTGPVEWRAERTLVSS